MVIPFYETRETITFTSANSGLQANNTLHDEQDSDLIFGSNAVYTDVDTREMHFMVNGRDGSPSMTMEGFRCPDDGCELDPVEEEEPEIE
jgi:hypothetical protein